MYAKIALLVMLGAGACSVGEVPIEGGTPDAGGGGGGDGGGGGGGGQSFNAQIAPLVTECVGCHVGTPPTLSSFQDLQAKYKMKPGAMNVLVTKMDGMPAGTLHYGVPYFTPAERTTVTMWIDSLP
jgi:hypothetical protein